MINQSVNNVKQALESLKMEELYIKQTFWSLKVCCMIAVLVKS